MLLWNVVCSLADKALCGSFLPVDVDHMTNEQMGLEFQAALNERGLVQVILCVCMCIWTNAHGYVYVCSPVVFFLSG